MAVQSTDRYSRQIGADRMLEKGNAYGTRCTMVYAHRLQRIEGVAARESLLLIILLIREEKAR